MDPPAGGPRDVPGQRKPTLQALMALHCSAPNLTMVDEDRDVVRRVVVVNRFIEKGADQ